MFNVGTPELIIIMAIALIVFGPKKLPEIGKSIGQGLRELRKASRDIMDGVNLRDDDEPSWRPDPPSELAPSSEDAVPVDEMPTESSELCLPQDDELPIEPEAGEEAETAKEKTDNATVSDWDRNN